MADPLSDFAIFLVDQRLESAGLTTVKADVKDQLVVDLRDRLERWLNKAMIDAMSEDAALRFETYLDGDVTTEGVQDFIANNVDNPPLVAQQALADFQKMYLGG